jgi:hypothetical protein
VTFLGDILGDFSNISFSMATLYSLDRIGLMFLVPFLRLGDEF